MNCCELWTASLEASTLRLLNLLFIRIETWNEYVNNIVKRLGKRFIHVEIVKTIECYSIGILMKEYLHIGLWLNMR